MPGVRGKSSLLEPYGHVIYWDADMLDELRACILDEMTLRAMERHLNMDRDAVGRGCAILCLKLLRGGLGDYGAPRARPPQ